MFQDWETLTFLHWRYDIDAIHRLLPAGLQVDQFDGTAWVGLVPFRVTSLRPPGAPALAWLSHFPETNVRTYVRGPDGEPGVWFFTLEADRLVAVIGARASFGLPYHWAKMRVESNGNRVEYTSRRNPHTEIHIRIGDRIQPGDLEIFLTARFRLYSTLFGKLAYANVHHEPWPLFSASVEHLDEDLMSWLNLPVMGDPLVHYSPGVHTRVAAPTIIERLAVR
jgi:uncharacterized protein YqjF (DUF2071 family)